MSTYTVQQSTAKYWFAIMVSTMVIVILGLLMGYRTNCPEELKKKGLE